MKATQIITTIDRGGAEIQLLNLTKALINRGYQVKVIYLQGKGDLRKEFQHFGCEVIDLSSYTVVTQMLVLRKILRNDSGIVHAHLPRAEILTAFSSIGLNRKYVVSRHNSEPFWPNKTKIISNFFSIAVVLRASAVIAISNAVREHLIQSGEIPQFSFAKLKTIHYGFPEERRRETRIINNPMNFRIGTIARLEEQKDLSTLLRALSRISEIQKWDLQIVGTGSLQLRLQQEAKILKISERIVFHGKISKVFSFLESLDLFVLPSKYEGFGAVLVEAMQTNVPIIATKTAAILEVVGENYPGLFEVGNDLQLCELIEKSREVPFRIQCIDLYSERLALFDLDLMADKIICVYRESVVD